MKGVTTMNLAEIDLGKVLRFLSIIPNPEELSAALEWAVKTEQFKDDLNHELDTLEAKRSKLESDIAKLEEDRVKKFHELSAIVPETEAQARTILEAAKSEASKIVQDAASASSKIRQDADAYNARMIAKWSKIREELS